MVKPEIVDKVPLDFTKEKAKRVDPILKVDKEFTSYYDGTTKLNAGREDCNKFSNDPANCVNNSHCGWCDDTRTCIPGTKLGPLNTCHKENYHFFAPHKDWNPLGK